MVSMTSLKYHTRGATAHPEGSTYEVDEREVENLTTQRLAIVTPATDVPPGGEALRKPARTPKPAKAKAAKRQTRWIPKAPKATPARRKATKRRK